MQVKLNLIAAASENMGIGKNGDLPWRLKNEMAYFTKMTTETKDPAKKNAVLMGRITWDCIPLKFRPLKNRLNVVLSRQSNLQVDEGVLVCDSLQSAIERLSQPDYRNIIENLWVIGGSHVYKEAINSEYCHRIYLTEVLKHYECDTFFPKIDKNFKLIKDSDVPSEIQQEGDIKYQFKIYENTNRELN